MQSIRSVGFEMESPLAIGKARKDSDSIKEKVPIVKENLKELGHLTNHIHLIKKSFHKIKMRRKRSCQ